MLVFIMAVLLLSFMEKSKNYEIQDFIKEFVALGDKIACLTELLLELKKAGKV